MYRVPERNSIRRPTGAQISGHSKSCAGNQTGTLTATGSNPPGLWATTVELGSVKQTYRCLVFMGTSSCPVSRCLFFTNTLLYFSPAVRARFFQSAWPVNHARRFAPRRNAANSLVAGRSPANWSPRSLWRLIWCVSRSFTHFYVPCFNGNLLYRFYGLTKTGLLANSNAINRLLESHARPMYLYLYTTWYVAIFYQSRYFVNRFFKPTKISPKNRKTGGLGLLL